MVLTQAPIELVRGGRLIVKADVAGAPTDAEYIASFQPSSNTVTDGILVLNTIDGLLYDRSGGVWSTGTMHKIVQYTASGTESLTTNTQKSWGFGGGIAPRTSKVLVTLALSISVPTSDTITTRLWRTTGSIPANGAGVTGTQLAGNRQSTDAVVTFGVPVIIVFLDTGLTPGTTYNYYISGFDATASTIALAQDINFGSSTLTLEEVP